MVKQWRLFRQLSQEELAARVGMKHSTIGRLERGQISYTQDTIEKLSDALDCSPSELLFVDPFNPGEFLRAMLQKQTMRTELGNMLADVAAEWKPKED